MCTHTSVRVKIFGNYCFRPYTVYIYILNTTRLYLYICIDIIIIIVIIILTRLMVGRSVNKSTSPVRVRLSSRVAFVFSVGPSKGPRIVFTPRRHGRISLIIACPARIHLCYPSSTLHTHTCLRRRRDGTTRRRKRGRPVLRFAIPAYYIIFFFFNIIMHMIYI